MDRRRRKESLVCSWHCFPNRLKSVSFLCWDDDWESIQHRIERVQYLARCMQIRVSHRPPMHKRDILGNKQTTRPTVASSSSQDLSSTKSKSSPEFLETTTKMHLEEEKLTFDQVKECIPLKGQQIIWPGQTQIMVYRNDLVKIIPVSRLNDLASLMANNIFSAGKLKSNFFPHQVKF